MNKESKGLGPYIGTQGPYYKKPLTVR